MTANLQATAPATSIDSFTAALLDGTECPLASFTGKLRLIVNTASQCGFTPQYAGLEALYNQFRDRGLVVLGFPCNQFGGQEPGSSHEIGAFCQANYGVTFPIFARIEVNGPNAHPLFQFLTHQKAGIFGTEAIKWNFTKFLIDRDGNVVERFAPRVAPSEITPRIETLL